MDDDLTRLGVVAPSTRGRPPAAFRILCSLLDQLLTPLKTSSRTYPCLPSPLHKGQTDGCPSLWGGLEPACTVGNRSLLPRRRHETRESPLHLSESRSACRPLVPPPVDDRSPSRPPQPPPHRSPFHQPLLLLHFHQDGCHCRVAFPRRRQELVRPFPLRFLPEAAFPSPSHLLTRASGFLALRRHRSPKPGDTVSMHVSLRRQPSPA
jgi:hypothetical protein